MLTRPKPNGASRRVIVDLSWPKQASVNHNVLPDVYMNVPFKLKFPTIDDIVDRIVKLKGKCLLYKVDIQRAFRILKLDPRDIKYTGLQMEGKAIYRYFCSLRLQTWVCVLSKNHRCHQVYYAH